MPKYTEKTVVVGTKRPHDPNKVDIIYPLSYTTSELKFAKGVDTIELDISIIIPREFDNAVPAYDTHDVREHRFVAELIRIIDSNDVWLQRISAVSGMSANKFRNSLTMRLNTLAKRIDGYISSVKLRSIEGHATPRAVKSGKPRRKRTEVSSSIASWKWYCKAIKPIEAKEFYIKSAKGKLGV